MTALDDTIAALKQSILNISPTAGVNTLQRAESSSIILTQLLGLRDRLAVSQTETISVTESQNNKLRNALIIGGLLLIL